MKLDSSPNPELEREILKKCLDNISIVRLLKEIYDDEFAYGGRPFIYLTDLKRCMKTPEQVEEFKKDAEPHVYTEEGAEVVIWRKEMADEKPEFLVTTYKLDGKIHTWKEGAKIRPYVPKQEGGQ